MESTVTRHGVPRGHESAAQTEADAVEPGTRVDGFRVQRRLGAGAMGEVYLAQDVTLGRWVALKLVKRQWMEPEGLSRFLEEARVTAGFSHPNIVTVHAFGQFHERPYLALEYLDGESLRERLSRGPLAEREALRVAKAIAEGIAEAHARGLVHADLKPSNVVIPKDGRVRIVDFGLARMVGSPGGAASGTHEYMAPERWTGAVPTPAIDVWALGLMLGEMIEGKRVAPPSGEGAAAWQRLVHRCLADDPKQRPSSAELVRALTTLCEPGSAAADRSPYRGLAAFTADDQADYLGRSSDLDAVAELMRASPVVPISGPSGIGKSSFVEAALVPRLAELAAWRVLRCRPGARPLEQLAAALGGGPALAAELRDHPEALGLHLGKENRRALLLVDQAEEAFTLAAEEAPAFFACIASLSSDDPSRVVLTVRDDFLGRLATIEKMRRHLSALVVLGPLSRADLESAIRKPLDRVGYGFDDPALPQRIAADVERQPAGLALLQFACQALWERRDEAKKQLLAHEYEAMRGPGGALAAHAERFLSQLPPEQVRWVRQVLLALVNADGTRRPRASHEVLEGLPPAAAQLVDRLLAARLVVAQRKAEGDTATLELAHEALTTTWPQLSRWLDETHELRALVQEVDSRRPGVGAPRPRE
ncbi:MAG: serine/threonine-protein kinase [Myxococcaceae bacterium]